MKTKEIRELTDAELVTKVADLQREKLNLKIQSRTGQLEKTARVREIRRDIARLYTEQTARAAKAARPARAAVMISTRRRRRRPAEITRATPEGAKAPGPPAKDHPAAKAYRRYSHSRDDQRRQKRNHQEQPSQGGQP